MKRKKASYSQKAGRVENRINLQIQSPELRVVGPDGEQLGILSRDVLSTKRGNWGWIWWKWLLLLILPSVQ